MQQQSLSILKKRQQLWLKSFPKVQVLTNQYETRLNSNLQYFRVFQIHSEPQLEKDSYEIHRQAMIQCPQSIKKALDCDYFAKRGYTIWYLTKKQLTKEQETKLKSSPPKYAIKVGELQYTIILKYIKQSHITEKESIQLVTQFMNIKFKQMIIRDCKMKEMTRNVFFPKWSTHFFDDKYQIEAIIGFKFSLQFLEIQLYCDVNNRIKQMNRKSFLQTLQEKKHNLTHYKGMKVKKMYGNYECFEIQEIVVQMSPKSTFVKNGKKITYAAYLQEAYALKVNVMNQPLILASNRQALRFKKQGRHNEINEKIYLIPQYVALAQIPDAAKNAARKQLFLTPNQCIEKADKFIKQVNVNQKEFTIYAQNRVGYAHLLPQPMIQVNNFTVIEPRDGAFRIDSQVYETLSLQDVLIVYSIGKDPKLDRRQIDQNVKNLNAGGQRYKVSIPKQPSCLEIKDNAGPEQWVKEVQKDMKQNSKPNLVIFAFMDHQIDYYPYIKQQLTYRLGIQNQVFLRSKLYNKQKGCLKIAGNIMKQIAAKKNKTLWKTLQPKKFQQKLVLIIGISIQKYGSKFELVISRSINKDITNFKTKTFLLQSRQIPDQILKQQFYSSLEEYIKNEKKKFKPSTIIVYRTGLNNEKFAQSHMENETNILKERVEYICKTKIKKEVYEPQIVYIRVFDRPSQKIWIQEGGHQHNTFLPKVVNPQVGTVMRGSQDNEFYLVSYTTRFGAVQPTLFKVFSNQKNIPIQFITQFTFNQSYMYYNWEGSVRLPQVLQLCKKVHKYVKPQGDYKNHAFDTLGFI